MTTLCSYETCGEDCSRSTFHRSVQREREFSRLKDNQVCIYCGSKLSIRRINEYLPPFRPTTQAANSEEFLGGKYFQHDSANLRLTNCECCGWWRLVYGLSYEACYPTKSYRVNVSKLLYGEVKHYDFGSLAAPLAALKPNLARKASHSDSLHPTKLEQLMRDCFSEHFGTVEIIHTGQTEDGAISLKMILTDSETYLVHVNRRSSISGVEDVRAVKALNGIIFRDDCAANMVVTTAPGFGAAVKQETAAINEPNEKYEIPLLAFHDILQLLRINKPSPYEPWMTYIEDIDYSEDNHFLKSTYFGREKCPHCSGIGKIWTGGGCTMEHGISTSCEEYGCPPRTETKCPVCNGDGDLL